MLESDIEKIEHEIKQGKEGIKSIKEEYDKDEKTKK